MSIPHILAIYSPTFLMLGHLLWRFFPNAPGPWNLLHVTPAHAFAGILLDFFFMFTGAFVSIGLNSSVRNGELHLGGVLFVVGAVCFCGFFYSLMMSLLVVTNPWPTFFFFALGFGSTVYSFYMADYPQAYILFLTEKIPYVIGPLMFVVGVPWGLSFLFTRSPDGYNLPVLAFVYYFLYLPLTAKLNDMHLADSTYWEGRSGELRPVEVTASLDTTQKFPPVIYRTTAGQEIAEANVDNDDAVRAALMESRAVSTRVVLLQDPDAPDRYTLPPPPRVKVNDWNW